MGTTLMERYKNAFIGLNLVKNKLDILGHLLDIYKNGYVIYKLKNGYKLKIPAIKKHRTTILSIEEIFGREIYKSYISNQPITILDIGSQIGIYSLYAALKNKQAKIFAFEPDPGNAKVLRNNIELNNLGKTIIPFEKAVTKKKGKLPLYIDENSARAHSLLNKTDNKVIVDCVSLSSIFSDLDIKECDIMKMDIEGAEYDILYNCSKKVLNKIKTILIECHDQSSLNKKYNIEGMKEFLIKNNYEILNQNDDILIAKKWMI